MTEVKLLVPLFGYQSVMRSAPDDMLRKKLFQVGTHCQLVEGRTVHDLPTMKLVFPGGYHHFGPARDSYRVLGPLELLADAADPS